MGRVERRRSWSDEHARSGRSARRSATLTVQARAGAVTAGPSFRKPRGGLCRPLVRHSARRGETPSRGWAAARQVCTTTGERPNCGSWRRSSAGSHSRAHTGGGDVRGRPRSAWGGPSPAGAHVQRADVGGLGCARARTTARSGARRTSGSSSLGAPRLYSRVSTLHKFYAFEPRSAATGRSRRSSDRADRPGPNRARHRDRAARPQARAHIEFDERGRAEPASGVPVRAGPGRGLRRSRTSTATATSTSRRASRSTPPVTRIPRVVEAIRRQAGELHPLQRPSTSTCPSTPQTCDRLAGLAPMAGPTRVYLGNSGAEVVEAGIKLARYATRRPNVVAFLGAFHGRTYGAVSLTASKAKYHAASARCCPASTTRRSARGLDDSPGSTRCCSSGSCRPTSSPRSSSSRSRARAATSSPTPGSCRAA